jgi:hypothetical protein
MRMRLLPLLVSTMAATSCSMGPRETATASAGAAVSAVVRNLTLEGGCWVLDTPAGRVQPLELPTELRRDGQRVLVVLQDAPDIMTTCQAGVPKHVVSIKAE